MDISALVDLKKLDETCKLSNFKVITNDDTGEVVKIICEFIPNDLEKGSYKQPLFRSTTTNR